LLGDHLAAAVQTFGSAALGVIDLPSLAAPGQIAPAQLRAAATLFWTMNVEGAGMPAFVDALAEAIWTGRMTLPIGGSASRLMEYRRGRDDRFTVDERRALYEQLFGPATGFPAQWVRLIDALVAFGTAPLDVGRSGMTARINEAALELAQGLSERAVGVIGFAGRTIVDHVRAALALLRDPEIANALGGGGVWQIIRRHAPFLMGRAVDPTPHLDRAEAGLTIIEWLAARAAVLEGGQGGVLPNDPALRAAERWRASGGVSGAPDSDIVARPAGPSPLIPAAYAPPAQSRTDGRPGGGAGEATV
jgi:hypothetical protein